MNVGNIGKILSGIFNKARAKKLSTIVRPRSSDIISSQVAESERIISAGWLLAEMDIAGGERAYHYIGGLAVTVGLEATEFKSPVHMGDRVEIYTEVIRQGTSSLDVKVEAFAETRLNGKPRKVTEGTFTFVHVNENGKAKKIEAHKPFGKDHKSNRPKASDTDVLDHEPVLRQGQDLSGRQPAYPRHNNYRGDTFGGWILDKMDEAGAMRARKFAKKLVVPRAIDAMTFHRPIKEGNEVSFYTEIENVGNTSMRVKVETWVLRNDLEKYEKVTEGSFTFVAVDSDRKPVPIEPKP